MMEAKQPMQLCEEESTLFGQYSRMYFTGLAALPWRTQLISGALPLNLHVRPLVTSLSGPRRTELQALLWPHIVHRYNVIFIDNPLFSPEPPPFYDNTMDSGFIVPMLLRIAESCGRRHLAQLYNEGPLAVVVCSTLEESLSLVESVRMAALQFDRDFRVVNVFETPEEKEFQEKSYLTAESCDVLIVALHSVLTLFATQGRLWSPPINLLKVELVVFRNMDVMLRTNESAVDLTLKRFLVNPDINYVFAASAPSLAMKKLVCKMENVVCTVISNFFDAVTYERLPIQLMETNMKLPLPSSMAALKTFEDRKPGERIILFVGTDKHAAEVKRALELPRKNHKVDYDFQAVGEQESVYDSVNAVRDWWKSETKEQIRILAIPDKFAGDFGINDADLIVHLAPPSSVQQFMQRFFCIKKTFMEWTKAYATLAKGHGEKVEMPAISCRIVIDDDWKMMLPIILQMASASEFSIVPSQLLAASQKILQSPQFLSVPLCLQQIYSGECVNRGSCPYRHYLGPKSPVPLALTSDSCVKFEFKLMRFLTPIHYIVRLMRCLYSNGRVISYERQQKDLDERLSNVSDDLPEPLAEIPTSDVVCGMLASDGSKLHRVRVLKAIDKDHIHVHYVDEGVGMPFLVDDRKHPKLPARVKITTKLYPLPPDVRTAEKTWTNVIVAKVLPSAHELYWRSTVCAAVYSAMKTHIEEKTVMEAKAVCSCEDFVFVDTFKSFKLQEGRNTITVNAQNIFSRFTRYAPNPTHMEKLNKSYDLESHFKGQNMTSILPMYDSNRPDSTSPVMALPSIAQETDEPKI